MKSKFNIKLFCFLTGLIFLILSILVIRTTYARYITSLTAGGSVELGRWLIKVNNQNIIENSDLSNKIIPKFIDSDYIAEGKIAPTSTGYVEINLDYQDVTVPFKYDVAFSYDDSTLIEDFKLISYSIGDGELVTVDDSFTSITETISPEDTTRTKLLKLNFSWVDGEGELLNDTQDTVRAYNLNSLGLKFDINFTQLQPII